MAHMMAPTYQTIAAHGDGIDVVIPPRSTAVPSVEVDPPTQRDRHLEMITKQGRLAWQAAMGYGRRSLVETTMGRYKAQPRLRARGLAAQPAEAAIGVAVLNRLAPLMAKFAEAVSKAAEFSRMFLATEMKG
jgi:hypothetical protein